MIIFNVAIIMLERQNLFIIYIYHFQCCASSRDGDPVPDQDAHSVWWTAGVDHARRQPDHRPSQRQTENPTQEEMVTGNCFNYLMLEDEFGVLPFYME